mmetsp:Transcript_93115/g.259367  ORF Transcript_93115/g.259367 Transcript_93115/m.259367 type:complete len:377 (+) Transcript_93115:99-1229(+)
MWRAVLLADALLGAVALYQCSSDVGFGFVLAPEKKGLAVDDITFQSCPDRVPAFWPNTQERVQTFRLFKAWDPRWNHKARWAAWKNLRDLAKAINAKILVSTQVTCNEAEDIQAWTWTKELLKLLGPEHVMGIAIGNELELLFTQTSVPPQCVHNIWDGGHFWQRFTSSVAEVDAMGFQGVPLTSAFGGLALAGNPFFEVPGKALVNSFLRNASMTYGNRFAFMWNIYPYFDQKMHMDPGVAGQCHYALGNSTCMAPGCNVPEMAVLYRQKMLQLTGKQDSLMWIGETGWSSPKSGGLTTDMAGCPAWSELLALQTFYRNFLYWDLSIGNGRPPDHVFYFTLRDSSTFGVGEHFGLIKTCHDSLCKVQTGNKIHHL